MKGTIRGLLVAAWLLVGGVAWAAPQVAVEDFFRDAEFTSVTLSPDGRHIGVTVPEVDRTVLAVLRVEDRELIGKWDYGREMHIEDVIWANNERILFRVTVKLGSLDQRVMPGDMYASNIDGTRRMDIPNGNTYGIVSLLRDDPEHILVQRSIDQGFLFRMNVYTGRINTVAIAPLDSARFIVDHDETLRYAVGSNRDNTAQTLRRVGDDWEVVDRADFGNSIRSPSGFSADNRRVYFSVSDAGEPPRIVLLDPETGEETLVSRDEVAEPAGMIRSSDRRTILAVQYYPHRPVIDIIEPEHPEAQLISGLMESFPDHAVSFHGWSDDGNLLLFRTYSDVDPGSFYLFDRGRNEARYLLSNRNWIDPAKMSRMRPIRFEARDGTPINGYLTVPEHLEPRGLPMVMIVHGGPHGVRDHWGWNPEAQFLASRGYAVMQLNYRGSGGYGSSFLRAGFRRWGTAMQDDLTDGVNWITGMGIVDPDRVCIYGGSYGGYAALMSVVREPDLYRCTIGYVGVYSIPMMFTRGDIPRSTSGRDYLRRVHPTDAAEQRAQSPAYNVERIRVPVMLVHGARDERVPVAQMNFLIRQMAAAGKEPELVINKRNEGHGFRNLENNVELYTAMAEFLDRHIGEKRSTASTTP